LEEDYINQANSPCQHPFDVTVPAGDVWVMGDHRHASADSAWHHVHDGDGFVPADNITGKAEVIFWPVSRWSGLGEGREAFENVPEQPSAHPSPPWMSNGPWPPTADPGPASSSVLTRWAVAPWRDRSRSVPARSRCGKDTSPLSPTGCATPSASVRCAERHSCSRSWTPCGPAPSAGPPRRRSTRSASWPPCPARLT